MQLELDLELARLFCLGMEKELIVLYMKVLIFLKALNTLLELIFFIKNDIYHFKINFIRLIKLYKCEVFKML